MLSVPETVKYTAWREQLFSPGDTVYVALSGGADSVTLLHLLCEFKEDLALNAIRALHVNHGLRGVYADRDESFVRDLCELLHVPLTVEHINVPDIVRQTHKSVEEAARDARYDFFKRATNGVEGAKIATAHTADDQAETVLMRIVRGCGLHGLTGIPYRRDNIVRPLLDCAGDDVRTFAKERGYRYIYDETNDDDRYTRNFVRNRIMPAVKQVNPAATAAVSRLSHLAAADDAYLQNKAKNLLQTAKIKENVYDCSVIAEHPDPIATRALVVACAQVSGAYPEYSHVEELLRVIRHKGSVSLPGDVIARADGTTVRFFKADRAKQSHVHTPSIPFGVGDTVAFIDTNYAAQLLSAEEFHTKQKIHKKLFEFSVNYDMISGNVYLRTRREGDALRPYKRGCTKTLKQFFQEQGIPAEQRNRIPLLCDENGILAILGYAVDERAAVTDTTEHILYLHTLPEGSK